MYLVAKISLGQLPIKYEQKTTTHSHTHCLSDSVQLFAPVCKLDTFLSWLSVNTGVFTGPYEISEANFCQLLGMRHDCLAVPYRHGTAIHQ